MNREVAVGDSGVRSGFDWIGVGGDFSTVKELAARHDQLTAALVKSSSAGAKKETESNVAKISANVRALKTQAH